MEDRVTKPLQFGVVNGGERRVGHESAQDRLQGGDVGACIWWIQHREDGRVSIDRVIAGSSVALSEDGIEIVSENYKAAVHFTAIERIIVTQPVCKFCLPIVLQDGDREVGHPFAHIYVCADSLN